MNQYAGLIASSDRSCDEATGNRLRRAGPPFLRKFSFREQETRSRRSSQTESVSPEISTTPVFLLIPAKWNSPCVDIFRRHTTTAAAATATPTALSEEAGKNQRERSYDIKTDDSGAGFECMTYKKYEYLNTRALTLIDTPGRKNYAQRNSQGYSSY